MHVYGEIELVYLHAYYVHLKPHDTLTTSACEEVDSEAFDLALEPEPDMAESEALSEEDFMHTSLNLYTHAAQTHDNIYACMHASAFLL